MTIDISTSDAGSTAGSSPPHSATRQSFSSSSAVSKAPSSLLTVPSISSGGDRTPRRMRSFRDLMKGARSLSRSPSRSCHEMLTDRRAAAMFAPTTRASGQANMQAARVDYSAPADEDCLFSLGHVVTAGSEGPQCAAVVIDHLKGYPSGDPLVSQAHTDLTNALKGVQDDEWLLMTEGERQTWRTLAQPSIVDVEPSVLSKRRADYIRLLSDRAVKRLVGDPAVPPCRLISSGKTAEFLKEQCLAETPSSPSAPVDEVTAAMHDQPQPQPQPSQSNWYEGSSEMGCDNDFECGDLPGQASDFSAVYLPRGRYESPSSTRRP